VNPGGGVDQNHGILAFATLLQKFLNAHQVLARSRVLCELGHALSAVEFLDGSDDCFTLRLCFGESNSVLKVVIGNINCCLHDSILSVYIFQVNDDWNTGPYGVTARMRRRNIRRETSLEPISCRTRSESGFQAAAGARNSRPSHGHQEI